MVGNIGFFKYTLHNFYAIFTIIFGKIYYFRCGWNKHICIKTQIR